MYSLKRELTKNGILSLILIMASFLSTFGQTSQYSQNPDKAQFILKDLNKFWNAFDSISKFNNPFEKYLESGSIGLKDFIPNRIINADSLLTKVSKRKDSYLKLRNFQFDKNQVIPYYRSFKTLYPYIKFPPVYFVMGRFNSAGTSSDNGLIIGVEMLSQEIDLPFLIIHECVHFQQKRINRSYNLLEQSIIEGSADFIAEIVTGRLGNKDLYEYCNGNQDRILKEFAMEMFKFEYGKWLYKPSSTNQPKDIGYWVGYKICQSIYNKAEDKKLAINRILNNTDYETLLIESGIFEKYLTPKVIGIEQFENNSIDVNYELTEITIKFNHKMNGSSFKPIREDNVNFPLVDVIGYSEDKKSFKLKIKLEQNKEYAFKVTGKGFLNEFGYSINDYEVRFKTKKE